MGKSILNRINANSCSIWVLLYGVFTGLSLLSQCLINLVRMFLPEMAGHLNENFSVPIEQIVWIYTIMCPLFIGVDRASFFALVAKNTEGTPSSIDIGHPERLRFIVVQSFVLYCIAFVIHLFFDVDVQMMPLSVSFGTSVLLYAVGQKSMVVAKSIANVKDIDGDGIDDDEQDPREVIQRLREKLANGETVSFSDLDDDGVNDDEQDAREVMDRVKNKHQSGEHITLTTNKKE